MQFISIPIRNLGRRPLRSSLTTLGIAVAVASFIAFVGLSRALERAWTNSLVDRGTHMLALRKGAVEILTASIDQNLSKKLLKVKGVRAVAGELFDLVKLKRGQRVLLAGWAEGDYLWKTLCLDDGRLPESGESNGIVIGQIIAEALKKDAGDSIRIRKNEFVVTGTFKQTGIMGNNTIILPLATMQKLMDKPGKVTEFNLRLDHPDNPQEVATVQSRLEEAFPDLVFNETSEIADNNDILQMLHAMAWSTSTIALVIALVVILNSVLMSVTERTREIGILSALGWRASRILGMIVLEGIVLSLVGSAIGAVLGIVGIDWLSSLPQVHGFLEPETTPRLLLEILGVALFLGVLGSLYPAWRAVRLNTVDALGYE